MGLPIITADQRLREKKGVKLVLLGKSGIGKTTQLKTLPEDKTLFVDLEAGDLAVKDWRGDCVRPTTWPEFRDLVVFLAGPNPALPPESPYSKAHYAHVCEQYGDPAQLAKYDCYFVDSITVLAQPFADVIENATPATSRSLRRSPIRPHRFRRAPPAAPHRRRTRNTAAGSSTWPGTAA